VFPVAEQLMQQGLGIRFVVSGNSMWPLIRHNRDSVLLKAGARPVRTGDIVLIRMESPETKYILHRVIHIRDDHLLETAGDGCTRTDGLIDTRQIIGRVEIIYRGSLAIDCNDTAWRILFGIWRICFPFRRTLLKLLRAILKLRAKSK